jgi:UDPglucose 6-dehydrogenase
MKLSILGTGFVGLITGVCLARKIPVICADIDSKKIHIINSGKSPFFEEGLGEILSRALKSNRFEATTDSIHAVKDTDITFISVGTPMNEDGSQNLQYIKAAAQSIGKAIAEKKEYHLVVVRSTVVPGTTRSIVGNTIESVSGKKRGKDFGLCMQPEFLREGNAIEDTLNPDKIVIGALDSKSEKILRKLLETYYGKNKIPSLSMSLESAEMVKYANNSFLATKVSFINDIANICQHIPGVDVKDVASAIGLDKRISPLFLNAGVGFGGSCFPKDVSAIISFSKVKGYVPPVLESVLSLNKAQAGKIVELARKELSSLSGKKVAILGLSFKPGTDDMREAPSIRIIDNLLKESAVVSAYDPVAQESARRIIGEKITYASSIQACLKDADACLLVTGWPEFKKLKDSHFSGMKNPLLIDGRRIIDPTTLRKTKYIGIGFGPARLVSL